MKNFMIYLLAILALCLTASSLANAQIALKSPLIKSCAPINHCELGLGKLDDTEKRVIEKLLSVVTTGATEEQITKRLAREPFSKIPRTPFGGELSGATAYKALWSTAEPPASTSGPHFDVLFFNDRAVMFSWYAASLSKVVRVQYVQ